MTYYLKSYNIVDNYPYMENYNSYFPQKCKSNLRGKTWL